MVNKILPPMDIFSLVVCLHDWLKQCLARWHHVALQKKFNQIQHCFLHDTALYTPPMHESTLPIQSNEKSCSFFTQSKW